VSISQGGLDPWAVQLRIGERDARYALGALLGPAPGRMMAWAAGVLPSRTENGVIVDLAAALWPDDGLGVRFYPGQCVIDRPGDGPYICTLDRTGRVLLDDADPSNPRIDLIVARVYDQRLGDPRTEFVLEPVTGTPTPEPLAPDPPPASVPLTRIALPAGTTQLSASMLTDLRTAAGVRGGVGVLLPGDDPAAVGGYAGQTRYRGSLEAFDGQRWRGGLRLAAQDTSEIVVRSGETGAAALTSLRVTDPGWPYRLWVNGSAELTATNCRADVNIRLDSVDGPTIAIGWGTESGNHQVITQTRITDVLAGQHTVYLCGVRVYGDGTWSSTPYLGSLTVLVLPA
jgi:hypothetical protein